MQKSAYLLLHGTIYGEIAEPLQWKDYTGKSASVCTRTSQVDWRSNLFSKAAPPVMPLGTMTDNAPIDVVSWGGNVGHIGPTGLEWWQQCMTLFMRHV